MEGSYQKKKSWISTVKTAIRQSTRDSAINNNDNNFVTWNFTESNIQVNTN